MQKQSEETLRAFRQMYESQGLDADSVRAIEMVTRTEQIDYQVFATTYFDSASHHIY